MSNRALHFLTVAEALKFAPVAEPCDYLPEFFESEFNITQEQFSNSDNFLSSRRLLDYSFYSSEVACAELFYFKGKPFIFYEEYGHNNGYHIEVTDINVYKECALYLYAMQLESINAWHCPDLDSIVIGYDESNTYCCFSVDEKSIATHILAPRWQMDFERMFESNPSTFDGLPVKFIAWYQESNEPTDDVDKIIVEVLQPNGVRDELIIEGRQVAFLMKESGFDQSGIVGCQKDRFGQLIDMDDKVTYVHCGGVCHTSPGHGGYGVYWRHKDVEKTMTGGKIFTTGHRMELMSAVIALESIEIPSNVVVRIDSEHVIKGIFEWLPVWKQAHWQTPAGNQIKNKDLWQRLDIAGQPHSINWLWLKNNKNQADDYAIQLAKKAMDEFLIENNDKQKVIIHAKRQIN